MREFKKWQNKREVKTIGYINSVDAYKVGEKNGWKAALEWVLDTCVLTAIGDFDIKEELNDSD